MDKVVFASLAFRHGYSEKDFYELLAGPYIKIRSQRGLADVYELLGRNLEGDYLHKVKNKKQSIPRLRRGASAEEIIGWTEKYDVFDRLDACVSEVVKDHSDLDLILQEALFQGNTAQLNMRIPPAMKAVLSRLARQRTTDATTLARIWLAERLRQEIAHD